MPHSAATNPPAPSLDAAYALVADDLKVTDALILSRAASDVPLIAAAARHVIASGGKRIRPLLTLISTRLFAHEGARQVPLAAAVEFIHTATLLHDDVIDESALRRGNDTANHIWGNKASILVGDWLLSQAFQLMVADGSLEVLDVLSSASAVISQGEVLQLMNEGNPAIALEDYLKVIHAKTAELFAAACEIGPIVTARTDKRASLRLFGEKLGMAFQLVDDALDYSAQSSHIGKTAGDDFREGKVTLPVMLAYAAGDAEEKAFWQRTLGDHEQEKDDFSHALRLLEKHQATQQSFDMARRYCDEARSALAGMPENKALSALLDIVDFCAARTY